jgi:pimeloyl-ACP methyl ester carboxylesterase
LTSPFQELGPGYSISLPGHYPAVFPENFCVSSLTPELIASLLAKVILEIVGNRKVLLVGHSTGGFAALCIAIYAPKTAAGIVSIAGFEKGKWSGALGINQWLARQGSFGRALFKGIYKLGGVNRLIYSLFWHVYVHDHTTLSKYPYFKAIIDSTFPSVQKLDLDAMGDYFTYMPHIDISSSLHKITAPTHVIVGQNDPIVPPRESFNIARKIANSTLSVIKGSGHIPFMEKPAEYHKALDSWLVDFNRG